MIGFMPGRDGMMGSPALVFLLFGILLATAGFSFGNPSEAFWVKQDWRWQNREVVMSQVEQSVNPSYLLA